MGRHALKYKPIKKIIFYKEPNIPVIYELTKDGRHTTDMKRAIRTNYKKLQEIKKENQKIEQTLPSENDISEFSLPSLSCQHEFECINENTIANMMPNLIMNESQPITEVNLLDFSDSSPINDRFFNEEEEIGNFV